MTEVPSYLDVTTSAELFKRAEVQAGSVPPGYEPTVQLYYIARYMVSAFEARDQTLPLQIWNEYRNAFDHFARHLTATDDILKEDKHRHLNKMEGHIQRAVLDICKFLCIYFDDYYKQQVLCKSHFLAHVSDGELLERANNIYVQAQAFLLKAKQADSNLGEEASTNSEIVKLYCDAVFEFMKIETLHRKNNKNIVKARQRYHGMQALSIAKQVAIGVAIAAVFFFLGSL